MVDSAAACARGRARSSRSRTQGEAFGGAKGEPEDADPAPISPAPLRRASLRYGRATRCAADRGAGRALARRRGLAQRAQEPRRRVRPPELHVVPAAVLAEEVVRHAVLRHLAAEALVVGAEAAVARSDVEAEVRLAVVAAEPLAH